MAIKMTVQDTLFNTPLWKVLDYLLQNPEQELRDTEIAVAVKSARKSAINVALRRLADQGFITRRLRGRQAFNKLNESALLTHLKIISNIAAIHDLIDNFKPFCSKIVLFGSRAEGAHTSESDFDIFVVSDKGEKLNKIVRKSVLEEKIQLIIKTAEEVLTLYKDEPALRDEIQKGLVLWQKD